MTQISTVTNAPFIQSNLESNGLQVDRNRKFSERIFSTPTIFKAMSKIFGSQGCSDDKTDLTFPVFSTRFVDFAVQFSSVQFQFFRCKSIPREATFKSRLTVA